MTNPLGIAALGMAAQETRIDIIANNLANMDTTGFQRRRAAFADLVYSNSERPGNFSSRARGEVPAGIALGNGVAAASVYRIVEQGNLEATGNSLDLAISGEGYLPVILPNGDTAYTRSGSLQRAEDGAIVTQDGYRLASGVNLPNDARRITVNQSGEVSALVGNGPAPTVIGQVQLARFTNQSGLDPLGGNLFTETERSGPPLVGIPGTQGFGVIKQGFVENSNVNPIVEISLMVAAMRAYQMNSKVVQTADQMLGPPPN